jgi:vacuolar protein sorting-associated protein 13D
LGKGLVGTVTKPVQGILDFTSGIANAAKEVVSSTGPPKSRFPAQRIRPPRVATSLNGTIPVYDHELATAQQYSLSRLSTGETKEM